MKRVLFFSLKEAKSYCVEDTPNKKKANEENEKISLFRGNGAFLKIYK